MSITKLLQAERLLTKGQEHSKNGKFSEAIVLFQRALEIHTDYDFAYLHKGLAHHMLNEYDKAQNSLECAINLNNSNNIFHFFMGLVHFDNKHYKLALNCFEQSLKLGPSHEVSSIFIGLCHLADNRFEAGYPLIKDFDFSYKFPESRLLLYCESFLFARGNKPYNPFRDLSWNTQIFDEPGSAINWHIKLFQRPAAKHYFKGNAEILNEKRESALADYYQAIELDKSLDEARKKIIQIFVDKAEYDKALRVVEEFTPDLKQSPEYFYTKGLILFNLEQHKDAQGIFEKGFEKVGRKDFLFSFCLGLCSIALQQEKDAFASFDAAVNELHPNVAKQRLNAVIELNRNLSSK